MRCAWAILYYLWSFWLHHVRPHYFINGTILGKKDRFEHKICVATFVRNIFFILGIIQLDVINVHTSSRKNTHYYVMIKLEFYRRIFGKKAQI